MTDQMDTASNDDITLTRAQQRAARTIDRNVSVEAGAGTGKTTMLTERYLTILRAHLDGPDSLTAADDEPGYCLPDDIDRITDPEAARRLPERIVVTTFTDRAAEDLARSIREKIHDRLDDIDDPDRWAVWRAAADGVEAGYIDTTHGFCSRILEEYAVTHPAVDPDFEVLEDTDAARLRTTVATELVESEPPGVRVLAPQFDRSKLVDVLAELIAESDMTSEWIDEIRDLESQEAYEAHLVELHPLDADPAHLLETVRDDLDTLCELYSDDDVADRLGTNPTKRVGNDVLAFVEATSRQDIADATPIEQLELFRSLCDTLTNSDGDRYGDGTYYGNKSFRQSDGPTATRFRDAMDSVLDTLAPATRPTDASLDPDRDAHELLTALADLAEAALTEYNDRKHQRGVLDYNDLIGHTLTFLTDPDQDAVADLREDLLYIMVDEFQDTNTRQWQLVQALTSGTDPFTADNVCVVGDVKQSIYRFRDADVTIFDDATTAMHDANTANGTNPRNPELTTNFRTLPETLQAINGLFDHVFAYGNDEPYEAVSGPLTAGRDTPTDLSPITEYLPVPVETDLRDRYLDTDHGLTDLPESEPADIEATALANRIAALLTDNTLVTDDDPESDTDTRPVQPEDIAVLIRSRSDLKDYERGLRAADIPYTVIKGEGFFDTPEIRPFIALLNALADPTDDIALYAAARSPLCGLTDTQLATAHDTDDTLWNSLQTSTDPAVESVVEDIERWREYAGTGNTPGATVESWVALADRILEETGYLAAIAADERGTTALANIDKLRDKLREFDANGVPSIDRVTTRLADQAEQGRKEPEANDATDSTGVRIMTVHEAKGQEFPVVAMPGLGKGFNDRARISNGSIEYERVPIAGERRPLLGLNVSTDDRTDTDATLMRRVARDRRRAEEHAEEKRILYVAATRAEDHLILTGRHNADGDHDTGIEQPDPDDPSSPIDWIQPALFNTDTDTAGWWDTLEANGSFTVTLPYEIDGDTGRGTLDVRLPPDDAQYDPDPDPVPATTERSPYTYEQPWEFTLSASDLTRIPAGTVELHEHDDTNQVTASPVTNESSEEHEHDYPDTDTRNIPAAIYGHAVHRLCETRPPRDERRRVIEQAIQEQHDRTPGLTESTYPDSAFDAIETAADAAIQYLNTLHSTLNVQQIHDEYYIELTLGNGTVSGFIDHLVVTPDTYHVIDYKTDRKASTQTTEEFLTDRATHHQPQLQAYAAALNQQDPTRDVTATLYFTDVEDTYTWEAPEFTHALEDTVQLLQEQLDQTSVRVGR
ncbi:UvrD-helicase domain-containing protein [Halolamina sp. CBA1230]|uniref:UvrD-helicase domain-containing protein n=1 Tax=Halolamina sp. CBA1230 TaxID=1853690 RepID=UPI0009A17BB0|nr:UvrD-helicase domain-containing protein [Halolamina sp. CBA1230]QKY19701.1 UvrD-helicase domain-containing protein [Halolamina sp. CBA1230]